MNIITQNCLKEFVQENNLEKLSEDKQFEHFANYIVVGNYFDVNRFELLSLSTGENAPGIDGIAIIVNNRLCTSETDVSEMIELNGYLDVDFLFIQTKRTAGFSGSDLGNEFTWIKQFFSFKTSDKYTDEFNNFINIAKSIYKNSKFFKKRNPIVKIFYLCDGKWVNDESLCKIKDQNITELEDLDLFSKIDFLPIDNKKTMALYQKLKSPVEATISIENFIPIPKVPNVKSSRLAILPFSEFRKLLEDEFGKLKPVFDDNIRGYLEAIKNPVNSSIKETVLSDTSQEFCLLNNGVTIVTEQLTASGNDFTLTNYQIVNGCQTSNVLFECRNEPNIKNVSILVKIIECEDNKLQVKVTRATNNQTPVYKVQLEALTDFQKELEMFYTAKRTESADDLYYERRTNQYRGDSIASSKIVNIEDQIKTFVSMFQDNPHSVAGNYGKMLLKLGKTVFVENHKYDPYYTSAFCYKKVVSMFNEGKIDSSIWRFRFHILMIIKYCITKKSVPTQLNGKDIEKYCDEIMKIALDNTKFEKIVLEAVAFFKTLIPQLDFTNRKSPEMKNRTDIIIKEIRKKYLGQGIQPLF